MKLKYALSTETGNPRYLFKKTEFNQNQKTDSTYWINNVLIRSNPHSWIHEAWILNLPILLELWWIYFQTARNNQNIKNNADTNCYNFLSKKTIYFQKIFIWNMFSGIVDSRLGIWFDKHAKIKKGQKITAHAWCRPATIIHQ